MKLALYLFIMCGCVIAASAQSADSANDTTAKVKEFKLKPADTINLNLDFRQAVSVLLNLRLVLPEDLKDYNILIRFSIDSSGQMNNITVIENDKNNPEYVNQIIKLLKEVSWIPETRNGKPASSWHLFPIHIRGN